MGMRWPAWWSTHVRWASPLSLRSWTSGRRRLCPGRGVPRVQPDAVELQLRQGQGVLHLPGLSPGSGGTSGQPGLFQRDRAGEVRGALRGQRPSGSRPGTGPSFARLFGAHPASVGGTRRQRRSGRLHRTCREAGEARVDVLGCGSGTAETGACSAAPAGEAETRTQSGSGCRGG